MATSKTLIGRASVMLASLALFAAAAHATDPLAASPADTEVRLVEIAESAEYREYRIVIAARAGSTSVTTVKDGATAEGTVPADAAAELWRFLLDKGITGLEDARPERPFADASTFVVEARVGGVSNRFSVYDVDSLADQRYRELVRKIFEIAERHAKPVG